MPRELVGGQFQCGNPIDDESVPGPTTEAVVELAARYGMAVIVPVHERDMPGALHDTAAVHVAGGSSLGTP